MYILKKKFLICWKYWKDLWGDIIAKHKTVNLGWIILWPNVAYVPHLNKPRLLDNFHKKLLIKNFKFLNFSYEIIWNIKKKRPKKMWNRMWLLFLSKILWLFYGDFTKWKFTTYCVDCISKKYNSFFVFLKMFEFWISMFLYWVGFANSLALANYWVYKGYIFINSTVVKNKWLPIKMYDHITFHLKIVNIIIDNIIELLFYAKDAARRRKCWATPLDWYTFKNVEKAHFIFLPSHIYFNTKTISLYWWKPLIIWRVKYYFSVNLNSLIKHLAL